ncbi:AraC-type DNA-binding protein [Tardiphaga sp. OK246]|uniref:helix-turn-helix transcriptional regulator n=1 Tax=Tardiphaga sp. OK246 TaxID=1855307 RepID=UPI000B6C0EC4|nr:AraC family transcriptional regulator [Tardiphaga sp. OK246]SNT32674.1 AraC-type DNA-binding protein [Tardiphaga sp. OK246]
MREFIASELVAVSRQFDGPQPHFRPEDCPGDGASHGFGNQTFVNINKLQHTSVRGVHAYFVDYKAQEPSRLSFAGRKGMHIHLRRRGTGRYAINKRDLINGGNVEMQVYCFEQPWLKEVFEDEGADARSILFGIPPEAATLFLGERAIELSSAAFRAGDHQRMQITPPLASLIDDVFSYDDRGIESIVREARLLDVLASSLSMVGQAWSAKRAMRQIHPRDVNRIREVESFVKRNLGLSLRTESLARNAGMSQGKFKSVFKEVTGLNIGDFVRVERLRKAADLLAASYDVGEVALGVGYAHGGYFARVFREMYQVSPHEFRRDRGRPRHSDDVSDVVTKRVPR